MNTTNTLVILAGGLSSRMKKAIQEKNHELSAEEIKAANSQSKGLIPLGKGKRPLMDYLLYNAREAGFKRVVIITGENSEAFKSQYGNKQEENSFHRLSISFATQRIPEGRKKPLGTADALLQAMQQRTWLQKTSFVVCNSDNLYSVKALTLLREARAANALISYDRDRLLFSTERINRFALMKFDEHELLLDIIEKPTPQESMGYADSAGKLRVSMNIFLFYGPMIYPHLQACPLHPVRQEKEIPAALLLMIKANPGTVKGIPLAEHVPDLTSKEDIRILRSYLDDHFPSALWKSGEA